MDKLVVERIDHVAVDVTDVERARAFYAGLLGLQEVPRPESFTFPGAWFEIGSAVLHLVGRGTKPALGKHHFALWVRDIQAAARHITAAGYPVLWDSRKIPGVDRFFTRDPDGNRVEIQGSDQVVI